MIYRGYALVISILILLIWSGSVFAYEENKNEPKAIAWWNFDAAPGSYVMEANSLQSNTILGNFKLVDGISGKALYGLICSQIKVKNTKSFLNHEK